MIEQAVKWGIQEMDQVPDHIMWLGVHERRVVETHRFPKRRADWLLGRWTAKQVILSAWQEDREAPLLSELEILAAPDGAPEAFIRGNPMDLSISLSHSFGNGFCCIGVEHIPIGCDLEKIEPRSPLFIEDYFLETEQATVTAAAPHARDQFANLIWSAKESALKVLRKGLRADTRRMEITLYPVDPEHLWQKLSVEDKETGKNWNGYWRIWKGFAFTIVRPGPYGKLFQVR